MATGGAKRNHCEETMEDNEVKEIKKAAAKGRKVIEKKAKQLERLAIEYVPVDSIMPNSYNANRQNPHDFELLLKSIREDGFTTAVVCMKSNREIVDGEHRWRAAKQLGYAEIPVVFVEMTEEQRRISTLRHNRARGSEDIELTAAIMRDLRELGALDWAQDSLMLDDLELERLMEDTSISEALAGSEFSTAWQPVPGNDSATGEEGASSIGGTMLRASSTEAVAAMRAAEVKIKEAKSAEERDMVKKETDIWRINLVFTGEEAKTVKEVLGDEPAQRLLALCKAHLASQPPQSPAAAEG
jgi:hypothetical protein